MKSHLEHVARAAVLALVSTLQCEYQFADTAAMDAVLLWNRWFYLQESRWHISETLEFRINLAGHTHAATRAWALQFE